MANREINMYEYQNIIYRLQQKQTIRSIAKSGLAGRHKVTQIKKVAQEQGWLENEAKLPDEQTLALFFELEEKASKQKSKAENYLKEIRTWVEDGIQASTIHQYLIENYGFTGAYNCVQRLVKKIKNERPPNLTVPLHFKPGEAAQVDFGKGPKILDERIGKEVDTWFFVMTLCWSRHQYVELIAHQDIETWLTCHKNAFEWFGGVVSKVIIDNPKCAITKACYCDPEVQRSYEALSQDYYFVISACPPRDPQKKGRVESGVKYVKKNFLPLRNLKSLQDTNKQLKTWVTGIAGNRIHGSTFKKPLSQFCETEQAQLKPLPTNTPEISFWEKVILYRDCHIRHMKCKYSAPYTLYGEELWAKITSNLVSIYHNHQKVADHPRKFVPGEFSTKQEHLPPNARNFFKKDASWCLKESLKVGEQCHFVVEDLLTDPVRDLLRQAQNIMKLRDEYGAIRLEQACKRSVSFNTNNYSTIKKILKGGLDYELIDSETSFDKLSSVYTGEALYQRTISSTVH